MSGPNVDQSDKRQAFSWLTSNSPCIRHALAQKLSYMRTVPNLAFELADVGAVVDVMNLIDRISQGDDKREDIWTGPTGEEMEEGEEGEEWMEGYDEDDEDDSEGEDDDEEDDEEGGVQGTFDGDDDEDDDDEDDEDDEEEDLTEDEKRRLNELLKF